MSGPFWARVPVISQFKSAVQAANGDLIGARQTQEHFMNTMPVLSQMKSAAEAASGDTDAARRTQRTFVDATPGIAQAKSLVHLARGDVVKARATHSRFCAEWDASGSFVNSVRNDGVTDGDDAKVCRAAYQRRRSSGESFSTVSCAGCSSLTLMSAPGSQPRDLRVGTCAACAGAAGGGTPLKIVITTANATGRPLARSAATLAGWLPPALLLGAEMTSSSACRSAISLRAMTRC